MKYYITLATFVLSAFFVSIGHAQVRPSIKISFEKDRLAIGESTKVMLESSLPEHKSGVVSFDIIEGSAQGVFSALVDLGQGQYLTTFTATQQGSPIRIVAYINGRLAVISNFVFVPSDQFDISKSKLELGSDKIKENEERLVKVTLHDVYGNPILESPGRSVTVTSVDGTSVIGVTLVLDNGDGSFYLKILGIKSGSAIHLRLTVGDQSHTFSDLPLQVVP